MTATNHAVTGALIGAAIGAPIALPLAFLSHFVCDAIPHFDPGGKKFEAASKPYFKKMLLVDALLCIGLALTVALRQPAHWWLIVVCAFLATSPDLMWFNAFRRLQAGKQRRPMTNPVMRFHSFVQWFQRPIGIVVEITWLTAGIYVLSFLMHK